MHARRMVVAGVALCTLFVSILMLPKVAASEKDREPKPLAKMAVEANRVDWQPIGDHERLVLTVTGPGNLFLREEFPAGQTPFLSLSQREGNPLPDGSYTYELRAREILVSGYFRIQGGSFVTDRGEPRSASDASVRSMTAPYTLSEDLIVDGHACIGESCGAVDIGYPLKLQDDLLGILFDDVNGISPRHDWAIAINSPIGAGEYFAIADVEDAEEPLVPFRIEAGAPDHSLYVSSNGNLGLGTSTPAVRLDVKASATGLATARLQNSSATGYSAIEYLDNAGNVDLFFGVDNAASTTRLNSINNNPIVVLTNSSERMRITSAGDIGVGTSTPSSKLHVNGGDIRVSGGAFIDDGVTLNAPDYVFEPSYSLMPLAELREFVAREKHLPNVPSAADIKKEGLNLSQFQMRLLEKVEELALYTLKQEEGLQNLRDENRELKARLEALEKALGAAETQ